MVLAKKQLLECFRVYREAFPDWVVEHDIVLSRINGPIRQQIGFQALRTGAYRPSCSIQVLPAPPFCYILQQWLDVKHREVLPRQHATKWPQVIKAMEEQFLPPIRKRLDVVETVRLAEEFAARQSDASITFCTGLATLSAYIDNVQRALAWCNQANREAKNMDRPLSESEMRHMEFLAQLQEAIQTRVARQFLDERMN